MRISASSLMKLNFSSSTRVNAISFGCGAPQLLQVFMGPGFWVPQEGHS